MGPVSKVPSAGSTDTVGGNLAGAVANGLNSYSDDEVIKEFVDRMSREHRTLQQGFTRLVMAWLKYLSETPHYDLRNEASVEMAKKIMKTLNGEIYLPLI